MIIFQTADFTLYRVERKAFVPNFAIATLGDVAQIVHRPTFRLEDRLEYVFRSLLEVGFKPVRQQSLVFLIQFACRPLLVYN